MGKYSQQVAAGCYNIRANRQVPIFHPGYGSISCQYSSAWNSLQLIKPLVSSCRWNIRNMQNLVDKCKKINTEGCNWVETFVEFMKEGNVLPSVK